MKCGRCGNEVVAERDGTGTCPYCGFPLTSVPTMAVNTPAEAATPGMMAMAGPSEGHTSSAAGEGVHSRHAADARGRDRRRVIVIMGVALALLLVVAGGGLVYATRLIPLGGAGNARNGGGLASAASAATATANVSSTPTTPSPTATMTPTATAQPRPTPTAAPQLVTIFQDPLTASHHNPGWPTSNAVYFASDGYHVQNADVITPVPVQGSCNVTVTIKAISAPAGVGLALRFSGSISSPRTYLYLIYPSPSYGGAIVVVDTASGARLLKTQSSALHTGANAVNIVGAQINGSHLTFTVNGTIVGSITNAELRSGQIAFWEEQGGNLVYSNLLVTKWE